MFDAHDDEQRRDPSSNNPYRREIDRMWWASFVSVEQPDGEVVQIAGVSGTYEQAEKEQRETLRVIRLIQPQARIIDCYYISRPR